MADIEQLRKQLILIMKEEDFTITDMKFSLDVAWTTCNNILKPGPMPWAPKTLKKVKAFIKKYKGDEVGTGDTGTDNDSGNEDEG